MRRLITYSVLPIIVVVLTAYKVNDKLLNDTQFNLTKYYFHEQNCLNVTKRCDLEIVKLINTDTIIYVKSSEHFGKYEEVWGKLTKINDSIFYVNSFRSIQQSETMPYYGISNDTLTFYCDSSLIGKNFKIEYLNKKTESHKIYSTTNRFHVDKTSFNSKSKTAIVSFDYPHPIINETVELKVSHHSDLYFTEDKGLNDFYLVFKPTTITTLNFQSSFGPKFTLKQMTNIDKLNRGRTIR